jgi:hypothetical protein
MSFYIMMTDDDVDEIMHEIVRLVNELRAAINKATLEVGERSQASASSLSATPQIPAVPQIHAGSQKTAALVIGDEIGNLPTTRIADSLEAHPSRPACPLARPI